MNEECEVVASVVRRWQLADKQEWPHDSDWGAPVRWLDTEQDYRTPSIVDRACRYISQHDSSKSKRLKSLTSNFLAKAEVAQSKAIKGDWSHIEQLDALLFDIESLCEEFSSSILFRTDDQHVPAEEQETLELLCRWNCCDLRWPEFAEREEGSKEFAESLRKKVNRFAFKYGLNARNAKPGKPTR